jgi:hypothetical protein
VSLADAGVGSGNANRLTSCFFARLRAPLRFDRAHHRLENLQAVRATKAHIAGAVRMRHQSEDITFAVADPRNVFDRTIRVRCRNRLSLCIGIAQQDLPVLVQLL